MRLEIDLPSLTVTTVPIVLREKKRVREEYRSRDAIGTAMTVMTVTAVRFVRLSRQWWLSPWLIVNRVSSSFRSFIRGVIYAD
jgi:hypothetical protein